MRGGRPSPARARDGRLCAQARTRSPSVARCVARRGGRGECDTAGDGAFAPNRSFDFGDITDGSSHTLAVAETKAYQPNLWDTEKPNQLGVAPPETPAELDAFFGGTFDSFGHTEWVEGDVHETGFTTTFTPNTFVPYQDGGVTYDIDLTSLRDGESATLPTYGAITARSFHPGYVNVALLDGSVRAVVDEIELVVWRAAGTRAGGEANSGFD